MVYFVFSPEWGRGHRVYTDDDITAAGGIYGIKHSLERESYWFARLGLIVGERGPYGIGFNESNIAQLPSPPASSWRIGRRNPAFARSDFEQHMFQSAFRAVERMLDSWKQEQDGSVDAYALKELKISRSTLISAANTLISLGHAHEIVEITVMKHWYDNSWPEPHLPDDDSVLADLSFQIPLQVRWSAGEDLITVEVMLPKSC